MYKVWIRGKNVDEDKAVVNVMSPTAQFGLNVFEGIRGYWNEDEKVLYIFKLKEHIDRLLESCKLVSILVPYTKEEIIKAIKSNVIANNFKNTDIALRVTIFADGIGSWHSVENFDMFISPIKRKRTDIDNLKGLKASISSWQRINDNVLPPRAKVGANYINGRYAYLQAKADGYDVPLFLGDDGKITESSGACVFIMKNNKLITPDVTSSILESITRKFVIEYVKEVGYAVEERKLDRTELYLADEVFLVGTAAEITPIVKVDKFVVGNGKVGKVTKQLLKDYLEIVSGKKEKYIKYLTPITIKG
jgi:branched-chain amino acid aminotransferase